MPRGTRKTSLEKLQEELTNTKEAIKQCDEHLKELKAREKSLEEKIKIEQFDDISKILQEKKITVEELKDMLVKK